MQEEKPEENAKDKRLANLRPPFEAGNPGGPGRPKGSRNLSTIIREALAAKAPKDYLKKLTARGIVLQEDTWASVLVAIAIGKAASGSIQHLREILDRTEGKARQPIDAEIRAIAIDNASDDVRSIAAEFSLLDAPENAEKENKENAD